MNNLLARLEPKEIVEIARKKVTSERDAQL
jgi:hypothetical protein